MVIADKLKEMCDGSDIEIVAIGPESAEVRLPYDISIITIEFEGDTIGEAMESFRDGVNNRLSAMIDHLNDCRL